MARQPRIDFPGAFHHVMNRGAARQETYRNTWDRKLFLEVLASAVSRFEIEIIAYALMTNHYHLFLRSPNGQLSETMQYIGRDYTQAFNARHGRDGALFRGRFHSVLVDSDGYFAQVVRYVELNPVKADLCSMEELLGHPWSSFQYSSGNRVAPDWLSTNQVTRFFGTARNYRRFARSESIDEELDFFYNRPRSQRTVLGSREFTEAVAREHPELTDLLEPVQRFVTPRQIDSLLLKLTGADPKALLETSQPLHPVRRAAIVLTHKLTGQTRSMLAARYGFSSDSAFVAAVRREHTAPSSGDVAGLVELVTKQLLG